MIGRTDESEDGTLILNSKGMSVSEDFINEFQERLNNDDLIVKGTMKDWKRLIGDVVDDILYKYTHEPHSKFSTVYNRICFDNMYEFIYGLDNGLI